MAVERGVGKGAGRRVRDHTVMAEISDAVGAVQLLSYQDPMRFFLSDLIDRRQKKLGELDADPTRLPGSRQVVRGGHHHRVAPSPTLLLDQVLDCQRATSTSNLPDEKLPSGSSTFPRTPTPILHPLHRVVRLLLARKTLLQQFRRVRQQPPDLRFRTFNYSSSFTPHPSQPHNPSQ